jgi:hypothetical protein
MEYPQGFPTHLQGEVDEAIASAEASFLTEAGHPQDRVRRYVAHIFFVFGRQVCREVGERGCTGEEARWQLDHFLENVCRRAYFEKYKKSDGCYSSMDRFEDETKTMIKTSMAWVKLQTELAEIHKATLTQTLSRSEAKLNSTDRKELVRSYRVAFPENKILDICWAAAQHYSEWKRWLRNAVKDGSAPDHAFRSILTSGKSPAEYRKQPRPDGWK